MIPLTQFTQISTLEVGNEIHTRAWLTTRSLWFVYSLLPINTKIKTIGHLSQISPSTINLGVVSLYHRSPCLTVDVAGCVWHILTGYLPLCSPRKTSLNFLNGLPNSPDELIVKSNLVKYHSLWHKFYKQSTNFIYIKLIIISLDVDTL